MSSQVVVGMLVHNAEKTLARSIESVLGQSHGDLRLIVSDDASTDGSLEICREYAARDSRIEIQSHAKNIGGIANFNSVVPRAAEGEFFMWASDHDMWHPDFLARGVAALQLRPEAVLCYPGVQEQSVDGSELRRVEQRLDTRGLNANTRMIVTAWAVPANTAAIYGIMRTSGLMQVSSYPNIYPNSVAPDFLLLVDLAGVGEFMYLDEPLMVLTAPGPQHDCVDRYLGRLRMTPSNELDALRLGVKLLAEMCGRVSSHTGRRRQTTLVGLLGVGSAVRHYGWIFPVALRLGREERLRHRKRRVVGDRLGG